MASQIASKPHIGIPYRTRKEELTSDGQAYDMYVQAVLEASGEPVPVSLAAGGAELADLARSLDGLVLPGSPADLDPARYGALRHTKCEAADSDRERIDFALLEAAFADGKPVLAICYGIQSLNVFLGGSLVQDISSELHTDILHNWTGRKRGVPEPFHTAVIECDSRLVELAGMNEVRVNSSHHQSVLTPGRNLRVVAQATDGVVEAVEWTGGGNWVTGVQWHPERMVANDAFARSLFGALVAAASKATAGSRS